MPILTSGYKSDVVAGAAMYQLGRSYTSLLLRLATTYVPILRSPNIRCLPRTQDSLSTVGLVFKQEAAF